MTVTLTRTTAAMIAMSVATVATAQVDDDFNDGALNPAHWCILEQTPNAIAVEETGGRLELSSNGTTSGDHGAFVYACSWAFSTDDDFRWRVDFHVDLPGPVSGIASAIAVCWFTVSPEISGGPDFDGVIAHLGRDQFGTFYGTEMFVDGVDVNEEYTYPAPSTNGTVYFSYHAAIDTMTISTVTYDGPGADTYVGLRAASGSALAGIALGGQADDGTPAFTGASAYGDNFVVDEGVIVPLCAGDATLDQSVGFPGSRAAAEHLAVHLLPGGSEPRRRGELSGPAADSGELGAVSGAVSRAGSASRAGGRRSIAGAPALTPRPGAGRPGIN